MIIFRPRDLARARHHPYVTRKGKRSRVESKRISKHLFTSSKILICCLCLAAGGGTSLLAQQKRCFSFGVLPALDGGFVKRTRQAPGLFGALAISFSAVAVRNRPAISGHTPPSRQNENSASRRIKRRSLVFALHKARGQGQNDETHHIYADRWRGFGCSDCYRLECSSGRRTCDPCGGQPNPPGKQRFGDRDNPPNEPLRRLSHNDARTDPDAHNAFSVAFTRVIGPAHRGGICPRF